MRLLTTFCLALATMFPLLLAGAETPKPSDEAKPDVDEYADFNYGANNTNGKDWVQSIAVKSPAYRAEVKGLVKIEFKAPGMTKAKASCWQQPTDKETDAWGHDATLAVDAAIDAEGNGSFLFPADEFPNGPATVRIYAHDWATRKRDLCELQLYNQGGVVWKQGIPKTDPPAAAGMKLVFSDDFDGDLSISKDGQGARYCSHKPPNGDFSGWQFADSEGALNPFSRVGTFLRIHAEKRADGKASSGLLSSAHMDGSGFAALTPSYFECRFVAQSAAGTWPAFWLLNQGTIKKGMLCDELDIVEAYGGLGKGTPNNKHYTITTHFWKQKLKDPWTDVPMVKLGGKSYFSTTFHIYAVKITLTDTIYFLDDVEVFRHPTGAISKSDPMFFLINYAIGGISGWKIDLQRYGNASDMYVDYVRVYQGGEER